MPGVPGARSTDFAVQNGCTSPGVKRRFVPRYFPYQGFRTMWHDFNGKDFRERDVSGWL